MMITPSYQKAVILAKENDCCLIPLCAELPTGNLTALGVLERLQEESTPCFLLESAERDKSLGRYSFLGFDPKLELTCENGIVTLKEDGKIQTEVASPSAVIRRVLKQHRSLSIASLPSFTGGLVGYFSFDYLRYAEPSLKVGDEREEGQKDVDLMLFDKVIAFDHQQGVIYLIVNIPCHDLEREYPKGVKALEKLRKLVQETAKMEPTPGKLRSPMKARYDKAQYCAMVEKAKEYIRAGDVFQLVLSNEFSADYEGSLLNTYKALRETNPSPYMVYLCGETLELAGASPETLVKLERDRLFTYPLAGTRPRGEAEEEDLRLEAELLADEKERAEHNMLVDLGRNDLGKISRFGSVKVEEYMKTLRFSHVMHLGSTIGGTIRPDCDALDAVEAVLPAGTLSGAPKLRAIQLIQALEGRRRGLYGGAVGYLDFAGNLDVCIAIRMAYKERGKVYVCSGAGIVADSSPDKEYEECRNKAKAVINALGAEQEG
jgi:anthranilate synthase component 1